MTLGLAVAAPNALAAQAAVQVAAEGGTAVDAAVAAALVTMVTEPGITAIGGGAYATLALPGSDPVTVDGYVEMPGREAAPERFGAGVRAATMDYGGGVTAGVGHGSVAVPGALAALDAAHRLGGQVPWEVVVEPAVHAARTGFPLGQAAALYLGHVHDIVFGHDPEVSAVVHHPDGRPLVAGDTVRIPHLARTLEHVAEAGAAALYTGDLAAALAEDMAAGGGLIGAADLAAYAPVVRPALPVEAGAWHLATNPPPSIGGPVLAAMLLLLDGTPEEVWTPQGRARIVAVQRAVLGHRSERLDTAPDRERAAAALLAEVAAAGPAWLRTSPSTAHVSVVDGEGRAAAITSSAGYGAGVAVPGTGLWLNNCLGEPELNRGGLHAWAPGTRLPSNMAPTVGRSDDGAVLALGSPGADRITTALLQVLAGLGAGSALQAAVDAPRVHVGVDASEGGSGGWTLDREADADVPAGLAEEMGLRERVMPVHHMYFGGVAAVVRRGDGGVEAAADPRRAGATAVLGATG
jgi:gamma-glutamyltranspeptidase / glutathione hydrolase